MRSFYSLFLAVILIFCSSSLNATMLKFKKNTPEVIEYRYSSTYVSQGDQTNQIDIEIDFEVEVIDSFDSDGSMLPIQVSASVKRLKWTEKAIFLNEPEYNFNRTFDTSKLGNTQIEKELLDDLKSKRVFYIWWNESRYGDTELIPTWMIGNVLSNQNSENSYVPEEISNSVSTFIDLLFDYAEIDIGENGTKKNIDISVFPYDFNVLLQKEGPSIKGTFERNIEEGYEDQVLDPQTEFLSGSLNWNAENSLQVNHNIQMDRRDYYSYTNSTITMKTKGFGK